MIAVVTLLVALSLSLLITRVATVALTLTGLSRQAAQFQVRSALTGCGFTTHEAESVMKHPVRRRIILTLMLLGNAGIVTVIASLMASLTGSAGSNWLVWTEHVALLIAGILVLLLIASSQWIDRRMSPIIEWALKRFGRVQACDYAALFRLANGYAVTETLVEPDDWLANRTLLELNLPAEGVLVLGIQREDGAGYIGGPTGQTEIRPGDTLILYGLIDRLDELDARKADHAGAAARRAAVIEQQQAVKEEQAREADEPFDSEQRLPQDVT